MKKIKFKELFIFGISSGENGYQTNKFCNGELKKNYFFSRYYTFTYVSESTGELRKSQFSKKNISGIAYT